VVEDIVEEGAVEGLLCADTEEEGETRFSTLINLF
jgi:hypothetical protein